MSTILSGNLLKLEHHAGNAEHIIQQSKLRSDSAASLLWCLDATANRALHSVLTKKSEGNLNDKDVSPQICIDVFQQAK